MTGTPVAGVGPVRALGVRLVRASARRVVAGLRTAKGAATALGVAGCLGLWLWAVAEGAEDRGGEGMLGMLCGVFAVLWLMGFAVGQQAKTAGLEPAEVAWLATAPLSDSSLARWAWTRATAKLLMASSLIAVMMLAYGGGLPGLVAAPALMVLLANVDRAVAVVLPRIGGREPVWRIGVAVLWLFVGVWAAAGVPFEGSVMRADGWLVSVWADAAVQVVFAPWALLYAATQGGLTGWQASGLLVGLAVVTWPIGLVTGPYYLEDSVRGGQDLAELADRMRRGDMLPGVQRVLGGLGSTRLSLGGGTLWRQALALAWLRWVRGLRRSGVWAAVIGLTVVELLLGAALVWIAGPSWVGAAMAGCAVLFGMMLLGGAVQLDLRGELDRVALIKTLPVPVVALMVSELLPGALVLAAQEGVMVLVGAMVSPDYALWLGVLALHLLPLAVLQLSFENAAFLWMPWRSAPGLNGMQAGGKAVLVQAVAMGATFTGVAMSVGPGLMAYTATGTVWAGALVSVGIMTGLGAVGMLCMTMLWQRFDPAAHGL